MFDNNKDSYTIPDKYVVNKMIKEYDIAKANISILLNEGGITKEQYDYFYSLPKKDREVSIGMLMRDDNRIKTILIEGFKKYRALFYKANVIDEDDILSVKKDAIYLIDRVPTITKFGSVEFVNKNTYTGFYRLPKLELYYGYFGNTEVLDVKGISDNTLELHQEYMLDFLKFVFCSIQMNRKEILQEIKSFYGDMVNRKLDFGYYREFNNQSKYRYKESFDGKYIYFDAMGDNITVDVVDCSYNLGVLRELVKIVSDIMLKGRI